MSQNHVCKTSQFVGDLKKKKKYPPFYSFFYNVSSQEEVPVHHMMCNQTVWSLCHIGFNVFDSFLHFGPSFFSAFSAVSVVSTVYHWSLVLTCRLQSTKVDVEVVVFFLNLPFKGPKSNHNEWNKRGNGWAIEQPPR